MPRCLSRAHVEPPNSKSAPQSIATHSPRAANAEACARLSLRRTWRTAASLSFENKKYARKKYPTGQTHSGPCGNHVAVAAAIPTKPIVCVRGSNLVVVEAMCNADVVRVICILILPSVPEVARVERLHSEIPCTEPTGDLKGSQKFALGEYAVAYRGVQTA